MIVELTERQLNDLINGEDLHFEEGYLETFESVTIRRLPIVEDEEALNG